MRCLVCEHPMSVPGLQVAMEQREHFASIRHVEFCYACASKMQVIFEARGADSHYWRQSLDCAFCGKHPIARFRFEVKDHPHRHIPVCQECYKVLRDDLVNDFAALVGFIDQEWCATGQLGNKRLPWPNGTTVIVRRGGGKDVGHIGLVESFRGLVQPWFGYDVRFADGHHHFFHERVLDIYQPKHQDGHHHDAHAHHAEHQESDKHAPTR